jgi:hypothetical protein
MKLLGLFFRSFEPVGFEVVAAVTVGVTPCNPVEIHLCFVGSYCLHLHGSQQEASGKLTFLLLAC